MYCTYTYIYARKLSKAEKKNSAKYSTKHFGQNNNNNQKAAIATAITALE